MARVTGSVGVRGDVRIELLTNEYANLAPGRTVRVGSHREPRRVTRMVSGKRPRVHLEGVESREDAERLRGALISVPLSAAVPLPPGRYYASEVVGARVVSTDGEPLGSVIEIMATGSNDVYVVTGRDGEFLVPAIADVVDSYDADEGVLRIRVIPGLR